jgi:hypothetical protein
VVIGAEIEQEIGVFQIGQMAVIAPGQFVGHVPRRLAQRGAVYGVRRAEGAAPGFQIRVANEVLALAPLENQLRRIVGLDFLEPLGHERKGFFPADLDEAGVLVRPLLRIGALQRLLQPIGVVSVVHARGALGANAMVVDVGARGIGIDRLDDAIHHVALDAAEVRADGTSGLEGLDLHRLGRRRRFGFRRGSENFETDAGSRRAAEGAHALDETSSSDFHIIDS